MNNLLLYEIILVVLLRCSIEAFPHPGFSLTGSRVLRNVVCTGDLYLEGTICCSKCEAGTHVKNPCTKAAQMGTCQECDYGKFTAHANGLHQCLPCTVCRSDQEMVTQCTTTQDSVCQCRPGTFCAPDQACELCKKCSLCKKDEETVRNCTSTTNTQCKKIPPSPDPITDITDPRLIATLVVCSLVVAVVVIIVGVVYYKKRCRQTDARTYLAGGMKSGQNSTEDTRNGETHRPSWPPVRPKSSAPWEDERKMLCESLSSSACNSQPSLTDLPLSACLAPPPAAHLNGPEQLNLREDEQLLKLVPVDGEESLRQCFGYFEEIDIDYHKRFFRNLGIKDNVIKSKDHLQYEDKIHELLNIWLENVGRDASLYDLLKALLDLNQRRTAEAVKENAIRNNHYMYES